MINESAGKAQVISFHCVMKNRFGQILSSSFNHDVINQRDTGNDRLPGLVNGLQSVRAGEKRNIPVRANDAYGIYDPRLVVELRRSEIEYGDRLKLGNQVLRRLEHDAEIRVFRVIHLNERTVVLDANHPLAGQDLVFEVEIVSAREASDGDFLEAAYSTPLLH